MCVCVCLLSLIGPGIIPLVDHRQSNSIHSSCHLFSLSSIFYFLKVSSLLNFYLSPSILFFSPYLDFSLLNSFLSVSSSPLLSVLLFLLPLHLSSLLFFPSFHSVSSFPLLSYLISSSNFLLFTFLYPSSPFLSFLLSFFLSIFSPPLFFHLCLSYTNWISLVKLLSCFEN